MSGRHPGSVHPLQHTQPSTPWQPGQALPTAHPQRREHSAQTDWSQGSFGGWSGEAGCWPELVGEGEPGGWAGSSQQAQPAHSEPSRQTAARSSLSDEPLLAPKACAQCRARKVKCNKNYPRCQQCITRNEPECDYGQLVPLQQQPVSDSQGERVPGLEQRISELEHELSHLRAAHSSAVPAMFAESIRLAFLGTGGDPERLADFLHEEQGRLTGSLGPTGGMGLGESSIGWRLTRPALANALSLHLITSFFSSCCAFLPAFDSWPQRAGALCANLNNLGPAERVAAAAFCAMGARASPHSALLGVKMTSPEHLDNTAKIVKAGARRQQACQSLEKRALDLCHELDLDATVSLASFEVLIVRMQMLIFNESVPKKARASVRSAFGHYRDLRDSAATPRQVKLELEQRFGLPLILGDAGTSASLRLPCLIANADLDEYFALSHLPELGTEQISQELDRIFPPFQAGAINHDGLNQATNTLFRWLASANRHFSRLAIQNRNSLSPVLFPGAIRLLWLAVDQIHAAVRRLQHVVIEFAGVPIGCAADGCSDLHCRMYTRLDRDADDITWLIHALLLDRVGPWLNDANESSALLAESDHRIRRGLKLVAFYFTLYVSSRDPHQTYHLTFQLELLKNWTQIATQRYGEQPGPDSAELELTESELDWLENGLAVAAFYHPCAEQRLQELRQGRRNHHFRPADMPALVFPTAVEAAMRQAAAGAADAAHSHPHSHPHSHSHPHPHSYPPQMAGGALPSQRSYLPTADEYTPASEPWHPQSSSFGALGEFEADENERAWATSSVISPPSLAPLDPAQMAQVGLVDPVYGRPTGHTPAGTGAGSSAHSGLSAQSTPIRTPLNLPPVTRSSPQGSVYAPQVRVSPTAAAAKLMTNISSAQGVSSGGSTLGLPKVSPPRGMQPPRPGYQVAGGMTAPVAQGQGAVPGARSGVRRGEGEDRIQLDENLGITQSERRHAVGKGRGAATPGTAGLGKGFLEGWGQERMQTD